MCSETHTRELDIYNIELNYKFMSEFSRIFMSNTNKIIYLCSIFVISFATSIHGQLILKDDFQTINDFWYWREDGNQNKPTVKDGLLHLQLVNAVDSEYCNTEIYDPTEPYKPGTQARIRLKASKIHNGSRGWGFWDGSLRSVPTDFDVAWVMQQGSVKPEEEYNWFLFGSNNANVLNRQVFSLTNEIDETEWNVYKIFWGESFVNFYIDDSLLYQTSQHIPDENMRMDIWIDNRVLNLNSPELFENNIVEYSEMFVDFIEISGPNGPSIEREIGGNILLWDSPNSFPNGNMNHLWKSYEVDLTNDTEVLLFITGSAEKYNSDNHSDDLKVVIDNIDYGWKNSNSLDGESLNGNGISIIIPVQLSAGKHEIKLYTNTTPYLKDVIIVSNDNGGVLFSKTYNETVEDENGLWKTFDFNVTESDTTTIIISGTAEINQALRFELNEKNYGWTGENSIDGNTINGVPSTIVVNELLDIGPHQLKIYNKGAAQLYSVAVYGSSTITDITDIANSESEKDNLSIRANPNPFNNSTIINYVTKQNSNNRVTIYNTLGQQVEILLDEFQNAGKYQLSWNPINQTSGIYICIMESDNYFKVEKLLLLK